MKARGAVIDLCKDSNGSERQKQKEPMTKVEQCSTCASREVLSGEAEGAKHKGGGDASRGRRLARGGGRVKGLRDEQSSRIKGSRV